MAFFLGISLLRRSLKHPYLEKRGMRYLDLSWCLDKDLSSELSRLEFGGVHYAKE